jgi:hypothetical protein
VAGRGSRRHAALSCAWAARCSCCSSPRRRWAPPCRCGPVLAEDSDLLSAGHRPALLGQHARRRGRRPGCSLPADAPRRSRGGARRNLREPRRRGSRQPGPNRRGAGRSARRRPAGRRGFRPRAADRDPGHALGAFGPRSRGPSDALADASGGDEHAPRSGWCWRSC